MSQHLALEDVAATAAVQELTSGLGTTCEAGAEGSAAVLADQLVEARAAAKGKAAASKLVQEEEKVCKRPAMKRPAAESGKACKKPACSAAQDGQAGSGNLTAHDVPVWGTVKAEFYNEKSYIRFWDSQDSKYRMILGACGRQHKKICHMLWPHVLRGKSRQELLTLREQIVKKMDG